MPAVPVRRLEVVDVEHREGDLAALATGTRELQLQDPAHGPLVGEARQRIAVGHPLEPVGPFRNGGGQPGPVDRHGGQRGKPAQRLPLRLVEAARRGPAEPDRPERRFDAARRDQQRQVGADERVAGRRRRRPIERRRAGRRGLVERVRRVGGFGGQSFVTGGIHAHRGGDDQPGTIGILDHDGAHRRRHGHLRGPQDRAERGVEVARGRHGTGRRGKGRAGVAGSSVAGHGVLLHARVIRSRHRTPGENALTRSAVALILRAMNPADSAR